MALVSMVMFAVLAVTAAIHALWGFGSTWPLSDKQKLINTVVGSRGMTRMPGKWLTLTVASGVAAASVLALWGSGVVSLPLPMWIRTASLTILATIFLVRGAVSYLPFGPIANRVEPFRTLNLRYYTPLILAIGVGYLALLGSVLRTH